MPEERQPRPWAHQSQSYGNVDKDILKGYEKRTATVLANHKLTAKEKLKRSRVLRVGLSCFLHNSCHSHNNSQNGNYSYTFITPALTLYL